jgi:hypothetical protein
MRTIRTSAEIDDDHYVVTVNGKSLDLTRNQFERYREWLLNNDEPLAVVFPDLTPAQRELLQ